MQARAHSSTQPRQQLARCGIEKICERKKNKRARRGMGSSERVAVRVLCLLPTRVVQVYRIFSGGRAPRPRCFSTVRKNRKIFHAQAGFWEGGCSSASGLPQKSVRSCRHNNLRSRSKSPTTILRRAEGCRFSPV